MAEKKVKVKEYHFGDGDFIAVVKSPTGDYTCYGSVAGKNIELNKKYRYPASINRNIVNFLRDLNIDYLSNANRCDEIANKMIEEGDLEKAAKIMREKK
jgi:hypothetical protein